MKKLLILFVLLFALHGQAQNIINADCSITLTVTAAGSSVPFDNRRIGCTTWHMAYMSTGFTAVSIQMDFSADNAGAPAAWTVWPAADVSGTLPLTEATWPAGITEAQITVYKYHPWVRVTLNSKTGTGTVRALAYGYKPWSGFDASFSGAILVNPASVYKAFTVQTGASSTAVLDASLLAPLNHSFQINATVTGKTLTACTYLIYGSLDGTHFDTAPLVDAQDCSAAATKTIFFSGVGKKIKYLKGTISVWTEGGAGASPTLQLLYVGGA
jgi:hypothetical protein